ncbi:MAG: universal stress protein [Chloroflexota bacterium]
MYKKILVPLDGSKRAEAILPHIESLAEAYGASVILMAVAEPESVLDRGLASTQFDQDGYEARFDQTKKYLSDIQDYLGKKGIHVMSKVYPHSPVVEAIINSAETEGVDLVAMASHGRSGIGRVFYGSTAAGVLHRLERPILLIRSL